MFLFIFSVLLRCATGTAVQCGNNQFMTVGEITNTFRCCDLCQAGFYMKQACTSHTITKCSACATGHYNEKWNNASSCSKCGPSCKSGKQRTVKCTHTTNIQCRCPVDTYWDEWSLYCTECHQCELGSREVQGCTETQNRKCDACPGGTYADRNLCRPCGRCRVGEVVVKDCTQGRNIECKLLHTWPVNNSTESKTTRTMYNVPTTRTMYNVSITRELSTSIKGVVKSTSSIVVWKSRNKNLLGVSSNVLIFCGVSVVIVFLCTALLGIWCRRRRMKMDTNKQSDGYDTSTEDIDQNGMKRNVYVTQGSLQKKPQTRVFDKGMLWRDIPGCYVDELGAILNPQSLADWSVLAGKLGFSQLQINNFRLDPTRATQVMLGDWGTSNSATVYCLYKTLKDMRRDDAAEKLLPLFMDPLHSIV